MSTVLLVALTGGIGSGKSTLAGALADRGAPSIDADGIARLVVAPGGPAHDPLLQRFGSGIRAPDGTIDRPALAAIVFHDGQALKDLNAITHPAISAEIIGRLSGLAGHDGPVVLDVPLLNAGTIEAYRPAAVVVVDVPEQVAVERLVAHRGFSEGDARARIAAQSSREERRALVGLVPHGRVVDNSGDRDALERTADGLWSWLRALGG